MALFARLAAALGRWFGPTPVAVVVPTRRAADVVEEPRRDVEEPRRDVEEPRVDVALDDADLLDAPRESESGIRLKTSPPVEGGDAPDANAPRRIAPRALFDAPTRRVSVEEIERAIEGGAPRTRTRP